MSIDRGAPEELSLQLAEILRGQIESGDLPPRRKLMPQLEMTEHYGLSRGTVARATTMLSDEGLVRWVKGRGLYVAEPDVIASWKKQRAAESRKQR